MKGYDENEKKICEDVVNDLEETGTRDRDQVVIAVELANILSTRER